MASETPVIPLPEQVKKAVEEVKKVKQEDIPKGSVEEEKLKEEKLPTQPGSLSELEEKIVDKPIEPPLVEEVKKIDDTPVSEVLVEEKSPPEDQPTVESVGKEPTAIESIEKDLVEQPPVEVAEKQLEEEVKMSDTPEPSAEALEKTKKALEVPVEESEIVVKEVEIPEPEAKKEEIPEPVSVVEDKHMEQSEVAEKIEKECAEAEAEKPKETLADKIEDLPTDKEEPEKALEALPVEESKIVVKEVEISEPEAKKEEIPEPVSEVDDKPMKQSEVAEKVEKECAEAEAEKPKETLADKIEDLPTDKEEPVVTDTPQEQSETAENVEKECAEVEPKESVKVQIAKDEETLAEKIEDPLLKEEDTVKEAHVVTKNPRELSEVAEKVEKESEEVEPKESVKVDEIPKEEAVLAGKIEDPMVKKEVTVKEEPVVTESSDQVTSTIVEAQVDKTEDGGEKSPTGLAESVGVADEEKELGGTDVVEVLPKEEVVESGKVELESEGKSVKTEEREVEKAVTEGLDEPTVSPTEVTEKALEVENTSRDIELPAENGKESVKEETVTLVEAEKNGVEEGKAEDVTPTTVGEPVEEPKKSETEVKGQEAVQTGETTLEQEKEEKPDAPVVETTKDGDDTITSQEPPKEEVPAKPSSKQSNNIMSKVKQSLVKAKKAILGKSPNPKTVSSEAKRDVQDK
ncbi:hypothetical protein Vadar_008414 [Vaccinium darrowii]|uniref:Uncharacterized protein n=1 Tax=Vaccinium darrowii TaxID=229202 RepID=A0ACB7WYZ2_9ERIC|nr:hypothetical protein Vadar_008414 [Vaccinium darrowii]